MVRWLREVAEVLWSLRADVGQGKKGQRVQGEWRYEVAGRFGGQEVLAPYFLAFRDQFVAPKSWMRGWVKNSRMPLKM